MKILNQFKHLIFCVLLTLCSICANAYNFEIDGIYYNVVSSSDLTCEVTYKSESHNNNEYTGEVVIPETIEYNDDRYSVIGIGSYAFYYCTNLTKLTIPSSITTIKEYAFRYCSLKELIIEDCEEILSIESTPTYLETLYLGRDIDGRFSDKNYLSTLTIGGKATTINSYEFYNCTGLTSVTIGNSVTSIGSSAFRDCSSLANIIIEDGENILNIETNSTTYDNPFYNCYDINTIYLGREIKCSKSYSPFINDYSLPDLTSITISKNVKTVGAYTFYGLYCTEVTIEESEDSLIIEDYSLASCDTLYLGRNLSYTGNNSPFKNNPYGTSLIIIGQQITSISEYEFYNCTGLRSITIPNSVTSIETSAFYGCKYLRTVNIEDGDDILTLTTSSTSTPFMDCGIETLYLGREISYNDSYSPFRGIKTLTSLTISDNVKSISEYEFYNCTGLTSATIGDNVTSIGRSAFYQCSSLTSITIPNSVTSIGNLAFRYCTSLKEVTISNNILSVNEYTFADCSSLLNVTIPNSVLIIEAEAFYQCTSLSEVTIPNSVTSIGDYAFYQCTSLSEVTIPNSVTSIETDAFYNCKSLTNVVIEDGEDVLALAGNVFEKSPIETLYLGRQMSVLHTQVYGLFQNTETLISLTISYNVTSILSDEFNGCTGLKSLTIPNSVTSIQTSAFQGCSSLATLNIEDGDDILTLTTSSTSTPFMDCGIETLYLGREISYNDSYSPFRGIKTLTSLTISDNVKSISEYEFYQCTGLTSATIGDNVASIGFCAFFWCSSLTSIDIPNSVITINGNAFYRCTSLISITIPNSVTSIVGNAFERCDNLSDVVIDDGEEILNIGVGSFENCKTLYLGRNIGYLASTSPFANITTLTTLMISDNVTYISKSEFNGCTNLKDVTIGSNVTTIDEYAFANCDNLACITSLNIEPPVANSGVFDNVDKSSCILYVPIGSVSTYSNADVWKEFFNIVEIGGTTRINGVIHDEEENVSYYTLGGQKINTPQKGNVYIVRYSDGTTKKVVVK